MHNVKRVCQACHRASLDACQRGTERHLPGIGEARALCFAREKHSRTEDAEKSKLDATPVSRHGEEKKVWGVRAGALMSCQPT
jgi:hypothetical protein